MKTKQKNKKYRFDSAYKKLYVYDETARAYLFVMNTFEMSESEAIEIYEAKNEN